MKAVDVQIKDINKKLQQFIKRYAALQKENLILSNEMMEYRKKEKATLEKIELLEIQTAIFKASAGKMDGTQKMEFEKRLSLYIKDLEKCMTMLNK